MIVEVINFSPYRKGPTYQGLLDVRLPAMGLEIRNIGLHEEGGNRWLQLPAKRYTRMDGSRGLQYFIFFDNFKTFQKAVLVALDGYQGRSKEKANGTGTKKKLSLDR